MEFNENNGNNEVNEINMTGGETGGNAEEQPMYRVVEEEDVAPLGFAARVAAVFASPVRLMDNIKAKPAFLQPLIAVLILSVPVSYLAVKLTALSTAFMQEYVLGKYGIDISAISVVTEPNVAVGMATGIGGGLASAAAGGAIAALIVLLLSKLFKGEGSFKQYFSMILHVYIMTMAVSILATGLEVAFGTMLDFTSLAAVLMPDGNIASPVFNILSAISVANVWSAVLYYFGLKTIGGFSGAKAGTITGILFVLGVLFTAVMVSGSMAMVDWSYSAMQRMQ